MTALFEVLQVVAALAGVSLFGAILFIGFSYGFKIYFQDRKKYLEEDLQRCKPHLDLETTVEYVKLCTNMGYKKKEIISQLYLLTQESTAGKANMPD
jgi:hypothetical protein